jgi:hypothetical protein
VTVAAGTSVRPGSRPPPYIARPAASMRRPVCGWCRIGS